MTQKLQDIYFLNQGCNDHFPSDFLVYFFDFPSQDCVIVKSFRYSLEEKPKKVLTTLSPLSGGTVDLKYTQERTTIL